MPVSELIEALREIERDGHGNVPVTVLDEDEGYMGVVESTYPIDLTGPAGHLVLFSTTEDEEEE